MAQRLQGKTRMSMEERENIRQKKQRAKDKFEFSNMGDF